MENSEFRQHQKSESQLLIDVGTNAEIILAAKGRILACSSPTGPALEGAQITHGQRAAPGAIERVRIDPETLEPRFRVVGCSLWSDEEGFGDQVRHTGILGICGSGIIEALAEMLLATLISPDGIIKPFYDKRTHRIRRTGRTAEYVLWEGREGEKAITVTQADVRAIQLVKGALYAGSRLLMLHAGIDEVDSVALAGAFGNHIDPKYAMVLGMIPDCDLDKVRSAGNAAGTGARIALLNRHERSEIERQVRRVEKIETAIEPRFQEFFVEAMAFPHRSDPYARLRRVVPIPPYYSGSGAPDDSADGARKRRSRRSRQEANREVEVSETL